MKYALQNAAAVLAAIGLVAACSSSTTSSGTGAGGTDPASGGNTSTNPGTGTTTTTTPLTIEAKLATAKCAQIARCAPIALGRSHKDQADCVAQKTPSFVNEVHAASAAITAAQVDACVAKLAAGSCDDYSLFGTCRFTGTLATGTACTHDAQCTSGVCFATTDTGCGSCADVAALGADCSRSGCTEGLYCNANTQKCTAFADVGAPCGSGTFCKATLACGGGPSGRTCKALLPVGGDCTSGPCADGLDCVSNKCVAQPRVGVGSKCGYAADGETYTDCLASQCTGLDVNDANGTCTAWPTFGTACDDNAGNACIDDLLCTNAKCTYSLDSLVCN